MAEHDAGSGTPAAGPPVLAHLVADVHRALIGGAVRGTGEYPVSEKYLPLQLPRSLSSTPSYSA